MASLRTTGVQTQGSEFGAKAEAVGASLREYLDWGPLAWAIINMGISVEGWDYDSDNLRLQALAGGTEGQLEVQWLGHESEGQDYGRKSQNLGRYMQVLVWGYLEARLRIYCPLVSLRLVQSQLRLSAARSRKYEGSSLHTCAESQG